MKNKSLPLTGLLTIGIIACASGSTAAATIENSISGANIADQIAIASMIRAHHINHSSIAELENSDISLIAIENIIDANINQVGTEIAAIAA